MGNQVQKIVDHMYSVFFSGVKNWSWTIHTMDRIKRWETKMMVSLFRCQRGTDETWVEFHTRCCKAARKIWIQMGLPFLYELIAENMWRAMGWVCDQRLDAVVASLKQVFRWRSSQWWHTTQTEGMRDGGTIEGNVWAKIATGWAGDDDWISTRKDNTSSADKTEIVTLFMNRMNLSTAHRKVKGKGKGKQAGSKPPRTSRIR